MKNVPKGSPIENYALIEGHYRISIRLWEGSDLIPK